MNRLAAATSPYLLQHAENPVDWHAWGDEAFELAEREGKPLLVSVGYSSCHWCHVMAHESFEDPATAALMNELFVNVKVDREERPDVDAVTMEATVGMTGSGGWPTTVFMTPAGKPFYAGTYFPPEPRHGWRAFAICSKPSPRPGASAARYRAPGEPDRRDAPPERRAAPFVRAVDGLDPVGSRPRNRPNVRARLRRLRRRTEVPGRVDARVSSSAG